jgi:hypothetical protein
MLIQIEDLKKMRTKINKASTATFTERGPAKHPEGTKIFVDVLAKT